MNIDKKNLDVREVLIQTVQIYKKGFKQFIGLSAISLITILLLTGVRLVTGLSVAAGILLFFIGIGSIYFIIRANIGIFMLSRKLLQAESLTLKESYRSSKGYCGTYFIISILFGLIVMVPSLGVGLAWNYADEPVIRYGLVLLFAIPFIYLFTKYYLAMPTALFSGLGSGEFHIAGRLVKGDFLQVMVITFLTYGIYNLAFYFLDVPADPVEPEPWLLAFSTALGFAIQILLVPVGIIASTVMYFTLKDRKEIEELKEINQIETLSECDHND